MVVLFIVMDQFLGLNIMEKIIVFIIANQIQDIALPFFLSMRMEKFFLIFQHVLIVVVQVQLPLEVQIQNFKI